MDVLCEFVLSCLCRIIADGMSLVYRPMVESVQCKDRQTISIDMHLRRFNTVSTDIRMRQSDCMVSWLGNLKAKISSLEKAEESTPLRKLLQYFHFLNFF